jgi:hypothetical protein
MHVAMHPFLRHKVAWAFCGYSSSPEAGAPRTICRNGMWIWLMSRYHVSRISSCLEDGTGSRSGTSQLLLVSKVLSHHAGDVCHCAFDLDPSYQIMHRHLECNVPALTSSTTAHAAARLIRRPPELELGSFNATSLGNLPRWFNARKGHCAFSLEVILAQMIAIAILHFQQNINQ